MPTVTKEERYVEVGYELNCGFERAEALAQDAYLLLKDTKGFDSAKDDTRGWDGCRKALVVVTYCTLRDAIRLDPKVRDLLSRKVDFTYNATCHTAYGSRGPTSYVTAATTVKLKI